MVMSAPFSVVTDLVGVTALVGNLYVSNGHEVIEYNPATGELSQ